MKYGLAPGCLGVVLVIVAIYVITLVALAIQMALLRRRCRARRAPHRAALLPTHYEGVWEEAKGVADGGRPKMRTNVALVAFA